MDVKLYVVSNLCNDIILGRDHLGACKAQIDYSKNVVRFDLKEGLFTVSDTVLLPGEEKHVRVRLRSRQRALTTRTVVVPRRNDNRIPDLVGNRQNVKLSGGKTCILMHNRGNKPMHLRKDLKVAISSQDKRLSQLLSQVAPYDNGRKPLENSPERIRLYKEAIDSIPFENTVLNPAETEEVKKLVWTHRDALSVNNELGCLRGYEHVIKLHDETPYNAAPYRLTPASREVMRRELDILLKNGAIKPCMSSYGSPSLLVRKDGSKGDIRLAKVRLVVSLIEMNKQSMKVKYNLPHIVETITQLEKNSLNYVTVIDLSQGFNQVKISDDSQKYTTFRTDGLGSYCLTRLPQGYCNASEVFQSCMESIFPPDMRANVKPYVDDLFIHSETFEEHLTLLDKVMSILEEKGLKIKVEKSLICQKEVNFLGYTVSREGIKVKRDKCEAILNMPRPHNVSKVRSFLGSLGYNHRFIKDFSSIARPLHQLTKKDAPFKWTEDCEDSYQTLRNALMNAPILSTIDYTRKLTLVCDASADGLGATLCQWDSQMKNRHVVAYMSRSLNPHERAYCITQREALCIVTAVKYFTTYLRFSEFEVKTDHRPLMYLFKNGTKQLQHQSRIVRWSIFLSAYDFTISFVKGDSTEIRQADWLSREAFEAPPQSVKDKALHMSAQELIDEELNCDDCMVRLRANTEPGLYSTVTADNQASKVQSELKADVTPSTLDPDPRDPHFEQSEGLHESKLPQKPPVKKMGNYTIPYDKLYKKLNQYQQEMYPRDKLLDMQGSDGFSGAMINYLRSDQLPSDIKEARRISVMSDQFMIKDGILYHIEIPGEGMAAETFRVQLYVPRALRPYLVNEVHSEAHMAVDKIVARLRLQFWWPGMFGDAQREIDNCSICQADMKMRKPYKAKLRSPSTPDGPAKVWCMDHLGPLNSEKGGKGNKPKYVLVVVDCFSMYVELIITNSTSAKSTARALLDRVITTHSFPDAIRHDSGSGFTSKILDWLTRGLGVKRFIGSAMNPRSQGICEARVKLVSRSLRRLVNSRSGEWHCHVPAIQLAFNMTPCRQTGLPAFLLQHGRMARDPNSLALIESRETPRGYKEVVADLVKSVKVWRDTANRHRQKYKDYMEKHYNENENVPQELAAGELVYVHTPFLNNKYQGIRRLNVQARGPFVIVEMIQGRLARLARVSDFSELPRLVNISRLRVTKLGMDPPKFMEDCELNPDHYHDWIPNDIDVDQPWDQLDDCPEEITQTPQPELAGGGADDLMNDAGNEDLDPNSTPNGEEPVPEPRVQVRLPAPIRVTRATKLSEGPVYRDVVKVMKGSMDHEGRIRLKVLCRGDAKNRAFWVDKSSLVGPDADELIGKTKIERPKAESRQERLTYQETSL